ncbi:N-formylglutamate deformylase [Rhodoferax sp. WC2427]|uniref:N-formylglutamate deformylase n=1 Tax=Rhodoferax sp. WC2427 TaxID=3234144 RepID=UPI0034666E83
MDTPTYSLIQGTSPILISIPHLGTQIPPDLHASYRSEAMDLGDTDWHLDRLYQFAKTLGASVLCAHVSRYVIDLNRPPDGASLYPGQTTTGLFPTLTFKGEPIYQDGKEPEEPEMHRRIDAYWQPYHHALRAELDRLRGMHPRVLLWEAHSIRSVLPRLFDGKLPDLNFGTHSGQSCDPALLQAVLQPLVHHKNVSHVVNGRFKGGYITRHFGEPSKGIDAIQLEMGQCLYMDENPPYAYQEDSARRIQPLLHDLIHAALQHMKVAADRTR